MVDYGVFGVRVSTHFGFLDQHWEACSDLTGFSMTRSPKAIITLVGPLPLLPGARGRSAGQVWAGERFTSAGAYS